MGGFGSGGHNNKGRKLVEQCYRLDATDLKRRGLMREGRIAHLSWRGTNDQKGPSVRVIGGTDTITLEYAWRRGDEPWQAHSERVALDWLPRHLGGKEVYFLCPKCAGRVKRIYGAGKRYLCRQCHNLVHGSTQERPGNRATRKNQTLRRKIGVGTGLGDWVGPKPKHMHQKTFERISAQIHAAEAEVHDDMLVLLDRLMQQTSRRSTGSGSLRMGKDFWR